MRVTLPSSWRRRGAVWDGVQLGKPRPSQYRHDVQVHRSRPFLVRPPGNGRLYRVPQPLVEVGGQALGVVDEEALREVGLLVYASQV